VTEISVIAALDDPVRQRLYEYVCGQDHEVSRDEAAAATGIHRGMAALHLDRLAAAGLLSVAFRRPAGRAGPGAGRPAKLYCRSDAEHQVSVPPRDYRGAAEILAEVAEVTGAEPAVQRVARRRGSQAGRAARAADPAASPANLVVTSLAAQGYQPYLDGPVIRLRNCPYHVLADEHPPLICGMNLALVQGLLDAAGAGALAARLDPQPGDCCVVLVGHSKDAAS
jgi:predicted ArsR family transcriptional regulator